MTEQRLATPLSQTKKESDSLSNRSRKSFSTTSITESQYSFELYRGCSFNPNTRQGRRFYVVQMLALHFIPVLALIVQNSYTLGAAIYRQQKMLYLTRTIEETTDVGRLLLSMQTERAEVAFYVFGTNTSTGLTDDEIPPVVAFSRTRDLQPVFDRSDAALERLLDWRGIAQQTDLQWHDRMFASRERFSTYLQDLRRDVLDNDPQTRIKLRWYDRATALILRVLVGHITGRRLGAGDVSSPFLAYINIMRAIEHLGLLMTLGLRYLSAGTTTPRLLARTALSDTLLWEYIANTRTFAIGASDNLTDILDGADVTGSFIAVRDGIINSLPSDAVNVSTSEFFEDTSRLLHRLRQAQVQLRQNIESATGEEVRRSQQQQMFTAGLLAFVVVLSLIGILMTRKAAVEMESFTESLSAKTAEVRRERRRADRLLCQMLPASVALQLKSMHKVTAESFKAVTVLFSDIVDFSSIAAESTPIQVMAFLNRLFKTFDNRIDRFDVYKVEAVETVYMCASGLPHRNGDRHVTEIADLALELLATAFKFEVPHLPSRPLQIRLGINTGPCVAGVVGTKMPRYCLFGDTVNTAARMEHTGLPMKIHLTQRSCDLLQSVGGYQIEFRGHIQVEGKGMMETYWLVSKVEDMSSKNVGISISDE